MTTRIRFTKEERINKIIEAAIDIIARDGFKQSSTKEIARLAECTEALVFKYFKTKDEILDFITQTILQQNDLEYPSFFNLKIDFKSFLDKIMHWHIQHFLSKKNLYKVIVRHECSNIEFGLFIHKQRLEKRLKPLIAECAQRKEKGEIKQTINCESLGLLILELLNSIKFKILFLDMNENEVREEYKKMFELLGDVIEK